MQLSGQPPKIVLPLANDTAARAAIPATVPAGPGRATQLQGFPPLTRTDPLAGGIPPDGFDMNGMLYLVSAVTRWATAGGGFTFDSTFANDGNVAGYPKGARVMRADGLGYWRSTVDGNVTDPDAGGADWVPDNSVSTATVAITGASTVLTATQAAADVLVFTGTLTANSTVVFPTTQKVWMIVNNTSGLFTLTCKTASGTGAASYGGSKAPVYGDGTNIIGTSSLTRGANGACTFNNGLVLQWATVTRVGTGLVAYTLPQAFPVEAFNGVAIPTTVDGVADLAVNSVTQTQIVLEYDSATNIAGARYFVVGR